MNNIQSRYCIKRHSPHHYQTFACSSLQSLKYHLDTSRYASVHKFVLLDTDLISSSTYITFFLAEFGKHHATRQTGWKFKKCSLSCELKLLKTRFLVNSQDVPSSNSTKVSMIKKRYSPTFWTRSWILTIRNEHHSTDNSITRNHPEVSLPRCPTEEKKRKHKLFHIISCQIWTLVGFVHI